MLEYVFFDERPRDQFVNFLQEKAVELKLEEDEGLLKVWISEDLDDDLDEAIEDFYDDMMALNQQLYEDENNEAEVGYNAAGIVLELNTGENVYAQVDPELLGRIMTVVTPDEFNTVVNAIVEAVENPDVRTPCQRIREGDQ
ncbi:MAG: hypothetical protein ACO378_02105 [Sedimenticolaceae bacterium]|jgi:hypothetical protein